MRLRELLKTPSGKPRLVLPGLVVVVLTFVFGFAALRIVQHTLPDAARAKALAHSGRFAAAEEIYVRMLRQQPSAQVALDLLENHDRALSMKMLRKIKGKSGGLRGAAERDEAVMSEDALDALLDDGLPPDVSLVARFWRAVDRDQMPSGLREVIGELAALQDHGVTA